MHHTPNLKSKAEILAQLFNEQGMQLAHQQALDFVARLEGFKDWHTASAAQPKVPDDLAVALHIQPRADKSECELFTALATVDVTMSAHIGVWAADADEARGFVRSYAADLYRENKGFELDEGNMRRAADFYLNETPESVSTPEIEGDNSYVDATYQVDEYDRRVQLSREQPDHSSDERRARVEATLTVSYGVVSFSRTLKVSVYGSLSSYARTAIEEGDFDEAFEALTARVIRGRRTALKKSHRKN
ncbi:glyoxalase superfamily protein [Burkholderia cenocepacia]|uniref:glyoxalase superfamily protein n=1 Tax=Burkholderia cenocepacia TaxID=95486 RepID=UPI0007614491|nr:glyoxalase superfamily protein [Burkholderia cenocepacia]KWU26329.1 hypothetical protein AS149_25405 [Burkholderia cenocepacia]